GVGGVRRGALHLEALRQARDPVAMAHPDLGLTARPGDAMEELRVEVEANPRAAELPMVPALCAAAELVDHDHLAVADAEHRHAGADHLVRGAGAPLVLDAGGAAGEDDGAGCQPLDHGRVDPVERMDLAVDAVLSQAPGDQLRDLAAEVDD